MNSEQAKVEAGEWVEADVWRGTTTVDMQRAAEMFPGFQINYVVTRYEENGKGTHRAIHVKADEQIVAINLKDDWPQTLDELASIIAFAHSRAVVAMDSVYRLVDTIDRWPAGKGPTTPKMVMTRKLRKLLRRGKDLF